MLYLFSANVCYAITELYYLDGISKSEIEDSITTSFEQKNYTLQKTNPFYGVSNKNSSNYALVMLESYGTKYLYYYDSNNEKGLNKEILKSFTSKNISYQQSKNEVTINRMAEMAQLTLSGKTKTYSFETPQKQLTQTNTTTIKPQQTTTLKGFVGNIGKGTNLDVYLQNSINTATANTGDSVIGVLKKDWVVNGNIIASQGSILYGNLTKAQHAKIGMRNGSVQINFTKLDTPEGKTYNISTEKIDFDVENDGSVRKAVTTIATAAAVGALVGLAFALLGNNGNIGRDIAIGAGLAGGVSLATQALQTGVDAEIPSYTDLSVVLTDNVNVVINY